MGLIASYLVDTVHKARLNIMLDLKGILCQCVERSIVARHRPTFCKDSTTILLRFLFQLVQRVFIVVLMCMRGVSTLRLINFGKIVLYFCVLKLQNCTFCTWI